MPSFKGQVDVTTSKDQVTVKLDGEKGDIRIGGNSQEGTQRGEAAAAIALECHIPEFVV